MSDYDSNYSSICCPFCEELIENNQGDLSWVDNLDDESIEFFKCFQCNKYFKAELNIYQEYNYRISIPTVEEMEKYELFEKEDPIEDVPGQTFMFED